MSSGKNLFPQILNLYRLIPAWILIHLVKKSRSLILDELDYWVECKNLKMTGSFNQFSFLVLRYKEYRNLVHYRLDNTVAKAIFRRLFPLMDTLYICTPDIGPRLFIQHGFATIISAQKIGSDCLISQQVTIGHTHKGNPVIGNGVRVTSGSKVVGPVTVGDNAIIGTNAVVVKDVAENQVVGGVPAKVIGINNDRKRYMPNK